MRASKYRIRLWIIGPFLLYFLIFLLWFPRWQHAPHSSSTRILGLLFGAMTAVLAAICIVGGFFSGPFGQIAINAYETFFKNDSDNNPAPSGRRTAIGVNRPPLMITQRLKDGTPLRGACPVCDVEFSTEAFKDDRTYPHESTLDRWYGEHFEYHIADK